jgi:hypothetical protein
LALRICDKFPCRQIDREYACALNLQPGDGPVIFIRILNNKFGITDGENFQTGYFSSGIYGN